MIAALGLALAVALAPPPGLCLTGGFVVDPDRGTATRADVATSGDTITSVGPPCVGERIDVSGRYLVPGFIDLHTHTWGNPTPDDGEDEEIGREATLRIVLRAGVMAVADLAGDNHERLSLRDRLRGSPDHAALFVAAVAVPPHGRGPIDEAALRARVQALAPLKPDLIKAFAGAGHLDVLTEEAHKMHLPIVVHISSWDEARAAVDAGADVVTHFEDEAKIPNDLVRAMVAHHTRSLPTMAVQCDVANLVEHPALLDDPLLARVTTPALRAAYRRPSTFSEKGRDWLQWQRAGCVPHDFASLRALRAAGIPVLAGSDTGNLGTFQGFSIHREMELMVAAGYRPAEALRAATTGAAAFLGIPWGLHPGAPANLVVLQSSPLGHIAATRAIEAVIWRGRRVAGPTPK